jgi:hypothetical protein
MVSIPKISLHADDRTNILSVSYEQLVMLRVIPMFKTLAMFTQQWFWFVKEGSEDALLKNQWVNRNPRS